MPKTKSATKSAGGKDKRVDSKSRTASASRSKAAGRNSKTDAAIKLAKRKLGINGSELMEVTKWPSGSAKYRVRAWAKARDMGWEPVKRKDGSKAYRLVPVKFPPRGKAAQGMRERIAAAL